MFSTTIFPVLVVIISCVSVAATHLPDSVYYSASLSCPGSDMRLEVIYHSLQVTSDVHCAQVCLRDDRCHAFNVHTTAGHCELSDSAMDPVDCDMLVDSPGFEHFAKALPPAPEDPTTIPATITDAGYFVSDAVGPWQDSTVCGQHGADMACVGTTDQYHKVQEAINAATQLAPEEWLWIGGFVQDGMWRWTDDLSEVDAGYLDWRDGRQWDPTSPQQCLTLYMSRGSSENGMWEAAVCSEIKRSVCYVPVAG